MSGLESYVVVTDRGEYFYGTYSCCSISASGCEDYYSRAEFGPDWRKARVFETRSGAVRATRSMRSVFGMLSPSRLAVVGGPGEPVETYFGWMRDLRPNFYGYPACAECGSKYVVARQKEPGVAVCDECGHREEREPRSDCDRDFSPFSAHAFAFSAASSGG